MNIKETYLGIKEDILRRLTGKVMDASAYTDMDFVDFVGPSVGINFTHEKFVNVGDGYFGCIYVYSFPKEVPYNWLYRLANVSNAISVFDISSPDQNVVKKNLTRSIEEQASRTASAKTHSDAMDANRKKAEMEDMYEEVAQFGNTMKTLCVRIFVPASTIVECDERIANIIADLEGSGYRCGVVLSETKEDWQASMLSYTKQQERALYQRTGASMLASTLAHGDPFHFTKLSDPMGCYYGNTKTGGSVFYDMFKVDERRMSYNGVIVGTMGSGKSTTLKKMLVDRATRGDRVRIFDVTGEFHDLVQFYGGKIIYLDGGGAERNSIINALQILQSGETDMDSYNRHISKVATIYKYVKADASSNEILVLKALLRMLYEAWGIVSQSGQLLRDVSSMKPEEFPTWSDFQKFIKEGLDRKESTINGADPVDEEKGMDLTEIRKSNQQFVADIELVVNDLCKSYGNIFDGHTTIADFYKEQIVCFNIKNLAGLEDGIFDAQLFSALSLCWDNCVAEGSKMKMKWDAKQIDWEDITRFLILIDEAHRIVNAKKLAGIEQITQFEREARKYFGGLVLASQSIRDFVPDGSSSQAENQMKTLFELCPYKWIMNQDSNCKSKLFEIFNGTFTEAEIDDVPRLTKGEAMLSIPGESTVRFNVNIADIPTGMLQGGA